ncbi:hypothetical protein [Xylella fastidiosa]|uniref:hypothetical protein n=1 Tax=Xylella fastidiosa TaxID=2371 RepID=UPI0009C151F2|nr:hypothetical protein [Xylella fastidiosa]
MSKLSVLEADSLFVHQYISSLTSFISDIHRYIGFIDESLSEIFTGASDVSDEITLKIVESISLSLADIFYQLFSLEARLTHLTSLPLP